MRPAIVALVVLALALPLAAQPSPELKARFNAHKSDFDYLLGDWEFTGFNKEYKDLRGYWSAARIGDEGGQLFDEFRIVGDKGETWYVTYTIRSYNAAADRWELAGLHSGSGLQDAGTGRREGNEVRIEQRFGSGTPHPSILRIRYSNIKPDSFTWTADRSTDDGKTWTAEYQKLEVHRIGPARSLAPLTTPKPK